MNMISARVPSLQSTVPSDCIGCGYKDNNSHDSTLSQRQTTRLFLNARSLEANITYYAFKYSCSPKYIENKKIFYAKNH